MAPRSNSAAQSNDAAPALTRTYEIQKFSGGRWVLDSVADDKKVAIEMSAALMKSGRAPGGVQVMSVQRGRDGQFSEVRIHRAMPNDGAAEKPAAAPAPKAEIKVEPKKTEVGDFKHVERPRTPEPKKSRGSDLLLVLKIAFGLGACAAVVETFRILAH